MATTTPFSAQCGRVQLNRRKPFEEEALRDAFKLAIGARSAEG
ncbi:hypothetical protein BSU04_40530 [Caballeronia sordidicola]|uniref:Uncharacterized protein n=1 Tax=Caballeronia sordidicola TaxID=196367 RepID=A0A226WNF3_CABSO|nr:hypothetical protein BSU04_40530 [Caballeronia sordidicola]